MGILQACQGCSCRKPEGKADRQACRRRTRHWRDRTRQLVLRSIHGCRSDIVQRFNLGNMDIESRCNRSSGSYRLSEIRTVYRCGNNFHLEPLPRRTWAHNGQHEETRFPRSSCRKLPDEGKGRFELQEGTPRKSFREVWNHHACWRQYGRPLRSLRRAQDQGRYARGNRRNHRYAGNSLHCSAKSDLRHLGETYPCRQGKDGPSEPHRCIENLLTSPKANAQVPNSWRHITHIWVSGIGFPDSVVHLAVQVQEQRRDQTLFLHWFFIQDCLLHRFCLDLWFLLRLGGWYLFLLYGIAGVRQGAFSRSCIIFQDFVRHNRCQ